MRGSFVFYLLGMGALLFSGEEEYITSKTFERAADKSFFLTPSLDPGEIQEGEIVHIRKEEPPFRLPPFFEKYHPHINSPYILITHRNTESVSEKHAPFLEDEKLLAWFAQNIEISHPKLHLIPLGIDDLEDGKVATLDRCRKEFSDLPRQHLLYMNFFIGNCRVERKRVFRLFIKDAPYCYARFGLGHYEEYLKDLASSKFVLSPRGGGIDCFRTWECLYMGAIPIVKSSPIDPLFEGLPVLIVKEWTEVNEEFLIQKYKEMQQRDYQWEKLTPEYWIEYIRSFKDVAK